MIITAGRPGEQTLLVRAVDGILGTHRNSGYQSAGDLLLVRISDRPGRPTPPTVRDVTNWLTRHPDTVTVGCGGKRGGDSRAGGRLSPGPAGPPRAASRLRGEEASEEPLGIREVAAVYLHPEPGKGLPHGDVQAVPGAAGDPRLQSPKSYAVVNKDPAEVAFG